MRDRKKDNMLNLYQSHRPVSTTLLSSISILVGDVRLLLNELPLKANTKKHTVVSFYGF